MFVCEGTFTSITIFQASLTQRLVLETLHKALRAIIRALFVPAITAFAAIILTNWLFTTMTRATMLRAHRIVANGTLGDALATLTATVDVLSHNTDVETRPVATLRTLLKPRLPVL